MATLTAVEVPLACERAPRVARLRPATERLHQLDGLRAIAALLVFFHHRGAGYRALTLAAAGLGYVGELQKQLTWSGVDLFFCLSGVVLLRPYVRTRRPFALPSYVSRRVARLWPAYLAAWLLAGAVTAIVSAEPSWWSVEYHWPQFRWADWAAQLGIVNFGWRTYSESWWTLTLEIMFYALLPLIVRPLATPRANRRVLCGVFIAGAVLSAALVAWRPPAGKHTAAMYELAAFAPCFLAGIVTAKFDLPRRWALLALLAGAGVVCVAVAYPRLNIHLGWALVYGGVLGLAQAPAGRAARWLSVPPLVWLGERSYSLFLTHYAVFALVDHLWARVFRSGDLTYLVVSQLSGALAAVLVAMLVFHLVERRFARNLVTADQFWPPLGPWR